MSRQQAKEQMEVLANTGAKMDVEPGLIIFARWWCNCTAEPEEANKLRSDFLHCLENLAGMGGTVIVRAPSTLDVGRTGQVLCGWASLRDDGTVRIQGGMCFDPRQPEITLCS